MAAARRLLAEMEAAQPLFGVLTDYSKVQQQVDDLIGRFAEGGNDRRVEAGNGIHSIFGNASKHLKGHTLRTIFPAATAVINALENYGGPAPESIALKIAADIRRFEEILDTFGTSHSIQDAVIVARTASQLLMRLSLMKDGLHDIVQKLEPAPLSEDEDSIVLVLEQHKLAEIAETLQALQEICAALELVFLQTGTVIVYRVRKIETDCLSIELVAKRLGIAAIRKILSAGVQFLYRNYTTEGQLKHAVPATAAAMKDAMKLRNLLEKEGIDVVAWMRRLPRMGSS